MFRFSASGTGTLLEVGADSTGTSSSLSANDRKSASEIQQHFLDVYELRTNCLIFKGKQTQGVPNNGLRNGRVFDKGLGSCA
ncbi:hypothetical protein CHS0354_034636 [Potamilus streckersoni]|uniref:Uncharacterized protein n=1 Tax=Potamilus streckersoni TaxID=2493646 RepID=A0AAE0WA01_9BIVA|nr:hypothetical protein CHS0354_034636 [Potamilus streckersoni]